MDMMTQSAPWPTELEELVSVLSYRPGWRIRLAHITRDQDLTTGDTLTEGLTLIVTTRGYDSYHPEEGERYRVNHYMPVPAATYDRRSWQRWLLDQFLTIERHEACEFFQIDGMRPYAPHHGPGNDPYIIFDHGTDTDIRTSYKGVLK